MTKAQVTLADWWRATGELPEPADFGEVAARELEQRYNVVLPDDFRAYVATTAPKEDFWDDENGTWWAPNRIKNIPEEYESAIPEPAIAAKAGTYLFFADHLIWCWAWAVCCDDSADRGKVAVITGADDRIVANTFTEFVTAYTADSLSVS